MNEQQTQVLTGTQTGSRIVIDLAAENPFTQFFCGDEPLLNTTINALQEALCDLCIVNSYLNSDEDRMHSAMGTLALTLEELSRLRESFNEERRLS